MSLISVVIILFFSQWYTYNTYYWYMYIKRGLKFHLAWNNQMIHKIATLQCMSQCERFNLAFVICLLRKNIIISSYYMNFITANIGNKSSLQTVTFNTTIHPMFHTPNTAVCVSHTQNWSVCFTHPTLQCVSHTLHSSVSHTLPTLDNRIETLQRIIFWPKLSER